MTNFDWGRGWEDEGREGERWVSVDVVDAEDLAASGVMLSSVNPSTSGVFAEYESGRSFRATAPLSEDLCTLAETQGVPAETEVTLYRGIPAESAEPMWAGIDAGDFVTTNRQLAQDYAGTGRVVSIVARYGDVLDERDEPGGEEYIYRPGAVRCDRCGQWANDAHVCPGQSEQDVLAAEDASRAADLADQEYAAALSDLRARLDGSTTSPAEPTPAPATP